MYSGALLAFLGHSIVCTACWHTHGAFLDITITSLSYIIEHKGVVTCTATTYLYFPACVCMHGQI